MKDYFQKQLHENQCISFTLDSSIFPQKNGYVNEDDNENDDESSVFDPELCPIEDFDEDESASPEKSFPLASQCFPSFAILIRSPVQYKKGEPLSSHWKTFFKGTGSTLVHEVRASGSSSLIQLNEIDPNLISRCTSTFHRKSSTRITFESVEAAD